MYTYDTIMGLSIHMKPEQYTLDPSTVQILNKLKVLLQIPIIEPLKATVIVKKQSEISKVINLLNKVTEKTYEKLKKEIVEIVRSVEKKEDLDKISHTIFNIASSNLFYSVLFSNLYCELVTVNKIFYDIYQEHYEIFFADLSRLTYVDPNLDYDRYCDYVKEIDRLDSNLTFFIQLMKKNIGNMDQVADLCMLIETKIIGLLEEEGKDLCEKMLSSVAIILRETADFLAFHKNLETIHTLFLTIQRHPSITSKMKYKCMDMEEYLK
jgi:hypothetical protein